MSRMIDITILKRLGFTDYFIDLLLKGLASGGAFDVNLPLLYQGGILSIQKADNNNDGYLAAADFVDLFKKWGPAGNAAAGGDFIGTTNAQALIFKVNNTTIATMSADGFFKIMMGYVGNGTGATGQYSFGFGYEPSASGNYSHAGGFQCIASGLASVALNRNTQATHSYAFACGSSSLAYAYGAFAANNAQVNGFFCAGFGLNNEIATDASVATSINEYNRIFFIGNGSATNKRHNALTVLHGADLVDGTKPRFGFNTLTPASTLEVAGSLALNYVAKTADYTAAELDHTIHFTANTSTFTLPTALGCTGRIYVVKNTSGNVLTLATTSGQTIDGAAPTSVANGAAAQFQSTGANWIKIN